MAKAKSIDTDTSVTESATGEAAGFTPAASETPQPTPSLVVTARSGTRRRAGLRFGPDPTIVPLAILTADEAAAIEGDPDLVVSRSEALAR